MKVKCIDVLNPYSNEELYFLKLNKVYDVLDEGGLCYLISDEDGDEVWVSKNRFEIVEDDDMNEFWKGFKDGEIGVRCNKDDTRGGSISMDNNGSIKIENDGILIENGKLEVSIPKKEFTLADVIKYAKHLNIGDSFESTLKKVTKVDDYSIIIESKATDNKIVMNIDSKFKFVKGKEEVSFAEAFKAYEEGKEIESKKSKYKKIDGEDMIWSFLSKQWVVNNFDPTFKEIRDKWYIND